MDRIKEIVDQYRYQIILGMVISLIVLLSISLWLVKGNPQNNNVNQLTSSSLLNESTSNGNYYLNSAEKTVTSSENNQSNDNNNYVDVKGAVKNPGVYHVKGGMRVSHVIDLAGGLTKKADIKTLNLAQRLTDQQSIYVPQQGEEISQTEAQLSTGTSSNNNTKTDGKINLNTADQQQMQQITGVGEKRAEQIIAYRQEHGNFKQIEDLKNVSGFGDKMFENMKDSITV